MQPVASSVAMQLPDVISNVRLRLGSKTKFKHNSKYTHLFILICGFLAVISIQNTLIYQKWRWAVGVAEKTHMFVVAAFYYNESKSLPPNTIAVIYSARKNALDFPITCISRNEFNQEKRVPARTDMALVAPLQCRWTTMVALCPVTRNPSYFALEGDSGVREELPFQPADKQKRNFIVCMSRMFMFENWQLFITSIELYRYYGADLMVTYIESALSDIYRILLAYEREGFVKIRKATRLFQPPDLDYDPNSENEWYNQDFSYNSCLYEFKESAEFMMIADWDDVLIPETHRDYYKEMKWLSGLYPNTAAFIFQRPQSTVHTSHSPSNFDMIGTIDNIEVDDSNIQTGKFVGRPDQVDGIWLHAPSRTRPEYDVIKLGGHFSRVYHFRQWGFDETNMTLANRTFVANGKKLDLQFVSFLKRNNLTHVFQNLPSKFHYYNELVKCYHRFASLLEKHSFGCPSLPKCELKPVSNLECTILKQNYKSTALLNGFYIHHSDLNILDANRDGCALKDNHYG
ncbi:unnamed protein product [Bursaphelenchus xylophilus]|uniref:Glycosyltransferase family 92 protein n=1 Tax=Bursaphelenchus xylophilus TaxID=6326 RepID=A0A1I7S297_BURXY|nr:unnamed protein product [Bursaphelenchus xylophilus]CAG9114772.1 unnamed protein product [Bursaphelenchus xylophilus]